MRKGLAAILRQNFPDEVFLWVVAVKLSDHKNNFFKGDSIAIGFDHYIYYAEKGCWLRRCIRFFCMGTYQGRKPDVITGKVRNFR